MAYLNLNPTLKNTRATAINTAVGTSGNLKIYTGTQPSDPAQTATGTLLVTLPLSSTFGSASGGVLTANAITQANAVATGTAGWARIETSGGTGQVDLDVGTSGASVIINTTSIVSGGPVQCTSLTITEQ